MSEAPHAEQSQPLPDGWTEHKTKAGKMYYYHAATKNSSWKNPRPTAEAFNNDGSFMVRVREMQATAACESGATEIATGNVEALLATTATPAVDETASAVKAPAALGAGERGEQPARNSAAAVGSKRKPLAEDSGGSDGSKPKASRFKATDQAGASDAAQEYLKQVQKLTAMDKQTDSSGGKWLVR
jgi:hypothetical protein